MTGAGAPLPPLFDPGPPLDATERERYARHLLLDAIGDAGQRRLRAARVLVVGAGGLGSPVLLYLAAAGVGRITVVDDDEVDLGNLQRQVIHSRDSIGRPKVDSARDRLAGLAPEVGVEAVHARLDATTVEALVDGHDVVVDGSDNFATRYLVSDACEIAGVPLVWGTLDRFRGQLSVFWSRPPAPEEGVTLRDLYPSPPAPGTVPTCAEAGVLGALCGMVGSMMAIETVKLITGAGRAALGRLVLVDALAGAQRAVIVRADPAREPVTAIADPVDLSCEVPAPGPDAADTGGVATTTVEDLAGELNSAEPPLLLDVRTAGERSIAAIEPSVWIPLDGLAEDVADPTGVLRRALAGGRRLVTYCKAGTRSARAARLLTDAGIDDVRSLDGGIDAWRESIDPGLPGY